MIIDLTQSTDSEATVVPPTPSPSPVFRFQAERVLLTYSQTGELTKEDVFHTLAERFHVDLYCLGQENHEDGGWHIHVLLKFKGKLDRRGADIFDVFDGTNNHHPNIKPVKRGLSNWEKAHEYVEKEDPCPLCNINKKLTWKEIGEKAATAEEFLQLIEANYPRDYYTNLQRYEYAAERKYGKCVNTIQEEWSPQYEHSTPEELQRWEENPNPFGKTLIIVGPAGCGKTTWAKANAPKPTLFVRHLDSLARIRPEHRSIIFDDLDFKHYPVSTQKFLVDYENLSEVHIRYKVARIPAGIPRIFTCNEYPFTEEGVHGDAIDRRVNKVFL